MFKLKFVAKNNKNHNLFLIMVLTCLLFCLNPNSKAELGADLANGSQLNLIGIGIHQELRNDIYIGALFGPPTITDAELLSDKNIPKRMSIHFISKYANRKLARHWKERLALNNSREKWQPLTKDIVQFSEIFKRNIEIGDELNIDYIPNTGTQVYLNGTYFQTFTNPEFYELLLNVWLGSNPPTKAFKNSIRGLDDPTTKNKMISQYTDLKAQLGRFDADLISTDKLATTNKAELNTAKNNTEKSTVKVASNKTETKDATKAVTTKIANKNLEDKPKTSNSNEPKELNVEKKANEILVDTNNANTPVVEKLAVTNEQSSLSDDLMTEIATPPKLTSSLIGSHTLDTTSNLSNDIKKETNNEKLTGDTNKAIPTQTEIASNPVDETFFDLDLASGSYTRDLINAVRKHEEYPRKALQDNEQGTVIATVTIDSKGEVLNIELIEKSGSRTLDRAVIKMVNKAAPFDPIPTEFNLQKFDFELPITFQL